MPSKVIKQYRPNKFQCSDSIPAVTVSGEATAQQDFRATEQGTEIIFTWVLDHIGTRGNEKGE